MSLLNDTLRRLEERTGRRPDPANTVTAGTPARSRPRWILFLAPAGAGVAVAVLVAFAFQHWLGPASAPPPEAATAHATPQPLVAEEAASKAPPAIMPLPAETGVAASSAESAPSGSQAEGEALAERTKSAPDIPEKATEPPQANAEREPESPREEPAQTAGAVTEDTRESGAPPEAPKQQDDPAPDEEPVAPEPGAKVASPEARSETPIERGHRLQASGQWRASIGAFEEHLQAEPDHAEARLGIARALRRLDRPAAAAHVLGEGPATHQEDLPYAITLALAHLESGDPQAARDTLSRLAPDQLDARARALLAQAQQRIGDHAEAARHYRALATQSGEGRYWLGLAHSLEHVGEPAQARNAYRRSLDAGDLGPASRRHAEARWETLAGHRR